MGRCFFILQDWKTNIKAVLSVMSFFVLLFTFSIPVEARDYHIRASDGEVYTVTLGDKADVRNFEVQNSKGEMLRGATEAERTVATELYFAAKLLWQVIPFYSPEVAFEDWEEAVKIIAEDALKKLKQRQIASFVGSHSFDILVATATGGASSTPLSVTVLSEVNSAIADHLERRVLLDATILAQAAARKWVEHERVLRTFWSSYETRSAVIPIAEINAAWSSSEKLQHYQSLATELVFRYLQVPDLKERLGTFIRSIVPFARKIETLKSIQYSNKHLGELSDLREDSEVGIRKQVYFRIRAEKVRSRTALDEAGFYQPRIVTTLRNIRISENARPQRLDVRGYFSPNGDNLTYIPDANDASVAVAMPEKTGSSVIIITPKGVGRTAVVVELMNFRGLSVTQTFTVTVEQAPQQPDPIVIPPISSIQRFEKGDAIIVKNAPPSDLYIRGGANLGWDAKGQVSNGATGTIIDGPRQSNGFTWWKVRWDPSNKVQWTHQTANNTGWVVEASDRVEYLAVRPPDRVSQSYDLAIQSATVNKRRLSPGEFFMLHITILNNGPDRSMAVDLSYYHSSVQGRSPTDPPQLQGIVSLDPIAPGKSTTKSIRLQTPLAPRTYYYGAWLAANTGDTDIYNDVATEVAITVTGTTVQTPNLPDTDLPDVNIPSTDIPTTPDIPQAQIPTTPDIPQAQIPTTPDIPQTQIPTTPDIPQAQIPTTPDIPQTQIPTTPDIPQTQIPTTPDIPQAQIPTTPDIPQVEIPPTPDIPSVDIPPTPHIPQVEIPPTPHIPQVSIPSVSVPGFTGFGIGSRKPPPTSQDICDRTQQVLNAILAAMDVDDCADLESADLGSITSLVLNDMGITALQEDDFEGLSGLDDLDLHGNSLSSLSVGIFDGMSALKTLDLKENSLHSLPVGIFDGLDALEMLDLKNNQLTTLPTGIFDEVMDTLKSNSLSLNDALKTTFGFSTTTQDAAAGETVRVTVNLGRSLPVAIRVPYTISGTATAADYKNLQPRGALLFLAGETSKEIVFTLLEDTDTTAETFLLTLGKLGGVKVRKSDGTAPNAKLKAHALLNLPQQRVHTVTVTTDGQGVSRPMYWTGGNNKIYRSKLDGTHVQVVFDGGNPGEIALDILGNKMYWVDTQMKAVRRANLDGSGVVNLVTNLRGPVGIALDVSGGKMYWTDTRTSKIQRSDLNGSGIEDLVTGLNQPDHIALDVSGGKMYWTDTGTRKIQRANLNGTNVEDVVIGLGSPRGIALDVLRRKMYWIDSRTDKIQRADLNGRNVKDLVTGINIGSATLALNVSNGKMYWADNHQNKVYRANLNGTRIERLYSGSSARGIALAVGSGAAANAAPSAASTNSEPLLSSETTLLPNYPNPFNPETWIPYRLAGSADVSISIYAADGTLVRTLDLGHRSVGIYESRSRARGTATSLYIIIRFAPTNYQVQSARRRISTLVV